MYILMYVQPTHVNFRAYYDACGRGILAQPNYAFKQTVVNESPFCVSGKRKISVNGCKTTFGHFTKDAHLCI